MDSHFFQIIRRQRGIWFTLAIVGAIFLFFQDQFAVGFNLKYSAFYVMKALAFSFILIAVGILLLEYLRGDRISSRDYQEEIARRSMYMTEDLRQQIIELRETLIDKKITKSSKSKEENDQIVVLTELDKEKMFDIITKTITSNINNEFLKSIDEKYSLKIAGEVRYKQLMQNFEQTRERVGKEIDNLSRRANLNLVIGSITTIIAVTVLFTSVYSKEVSITDTAKTLSYFIPRISTVIFIEVFSFFFLKLYRSNLNDIKYYQNEMTNIEFKTLSLKSALMTDDKETLKQIISETNKIERNFILQKGETTAEIETSKNQNRFDKSFTDNLKMLVDSLSKLRGKNNDS